MRKSRKLNPKSWLPKFKLKNQMDNSKFKTKAGLVTPYGLACGYVQEYWYGGERVSLWREGGPAIHVRGATWESFNKLSEARKNFNQQKRKLREKMNSQFFEKLANVLLGEKLPLDILNGKTNELLIPANKKITAAMLEKLIQFRHEIELDPSPIRNKLFQILEI